MSDGSGRPAWLVEDSSWLPDESAFARYDANADLGLLFTDGEHDVLVFEDIGTPAVDAFDALRLGLDAPGMPNASQRGGLEPLTCGATDPERLDGGLPLLILARRESGVPFAAVQRWEQVERLVEQDRPRRARGESPLPSLESDPGDVPGRRRLGWFVRSVLVIAAIVVGGIAGLLAVDSDGPVGYSVRDATTSVNPFPSGAQLRVSSGDQDQSLVVLRRPSRNVTTFRQVRWTLDEPLTITYWPGNADDEGHTVSIDLRDQGATALNQGWYVVIDLEVFDGFTVLTITQPTQQLVNLERTTAHQVVLERQIPGSSVTASGTTPQPTPRAPVDDAGYDACIQDEIARYLPLLDDLDLVGQYKEVESEYLADGGISQAEASALARRMRLQASDLEALLEYSGLLSSRPSDSPLPDLFERMLTLQEQLARAWESSGTDAINAVYGDFSSSSFFLGSFSVYLDADARVSCR